MSNCRILYENYLAADKWKFVVTIDEAWFYLEDCEIITPKLEINFMINTIKKDVKVLKKGSW